MGALGARHRDALVGLVRGTRGGASAIDLPGGRAEREYGALSFRGRGQPGEAEPGAGAGADDARASPTSVAAANELEPGVRLAPVVLGPDGPYTVRNWRAGDRMRPARLRGRSRKLSDLYTDLRVPRGSRHSARVVVDALGAIVWAEHIGRAHAREVQVSLTGVEGVARK
jgi:tRNA(Ile)-lysidine synthase